MNYENLFDFVLSIPLFCWWARGGGGGISIPTDHLLREGSEQIFSSPLSSALTSALTSALSSAFGVVVLGVDGLIGRLVVRVISGRSASD